MKKAKNSEEASKIQNTYENVSYGHIQWKGTDVCMDLICDCGNLSHIDGEFNQHVKCPKCMRVYLCNPNIELIELENEPDYCVNMEIL